MSKFWGYALIFLVILIYVVFSLLAAMAQLLTLPVGWYLVSGAFLIFVFGSVGLAVMAIVRWVWLRLTSPSAIEKQMIEQRARESERFFAMTIPDTWAEEQDLWHRSGVGHPKGFVRLGWDRLNNRPLDLAPEHLGRHVAMIGVTGSGKTTAIGRLVEGVLTLGWSAVILDCKGGGLRDTARRLAEAAELPCRILDPLEASTLAYNP
ncbi:MAG: helicase HerA domain-containing protein, partial [Candidatus Dormibacteraceae bacterium]